MIIFGHERLRRNIAEFKSVTGVEAELRRDFIGEFFKNVVIRGLGNLFNKIFMIEKATQWSQDKAQQWSEDVGNKFAGLKRRMSLQNVVNTSNDGKSDKPGKSVNSAYATPKPVAVPVPPILASTLTRTDTIDPLSQLEDSLHTKRRNILKEKRLNQVNKASRLQTTNTARRTDANARNKVGTAIKAVAVKSKILSTITTFILNILSIIWLIPIFLTIAIIQIITLLRFWHPLNKRLFDIYNQRIFISDQIFLSTYTLELLVEFCSLIYIDTALAFQLAKHLPGGENLDADIIEARHLRRPPICFQALIFSVLLEFVIYLVDFLDTPGSSSRRRFDYLKDSMDKVEGYLAAIWFPARNVNYQAIGSNYRQTITLICLLAITPVWIPISLTLYGLLAFFKYCFKIIRYHKFIAILFPIAILNTLEFTYVELMVFPDNIAEHLLLLINNIVTMLLVFECFYNLINYICFSWLDKRFTFPELVTLVFGFIVTLATLLRASFNFGFFGVGFGTIFGLPRLDNSCNFNAIDLFAYFPDFSRTITSLKPACINAKRESVQWWAEDCGIPVRPINTERYDIDRSFNVIYNYYLYYYEYVIIYELFIVVFVSVSLYLFIMLLQFLYYILGKILRTLYSGRESGRCQLYNKERYLTKTNQNDRSVCRPKDKVNILCTVFDFNQYGVCGHCVCYPIFCCSLQPVLCRQAINTCLKCARKEDC